MTNSDEAPQPRAGSEADISVVIVSYRTPELIAECISSVHRTAGALKVQVVVVDNASGDGTPRMLRNRFPGDMIIEAAENGGFARGNTIGFRHATGARILLLNPDAELFEGSLATAVAALDGAPDIGVVGARAQLPDGRLQSTMIRFPSLRSLMFAVVLPSAMARRYVWAGDFRYASRDPSQVQEVDAVAGGFMLVKRSVIDQVGGLDPRFFMYGEEVEWCHRIRRAGWRIVYHPEVRMLHHGGASSSDRHVWRAREMMRGQLLYFAIVRGRWYARVAALLMVMRDIVRMPAVVLLTLTGRHSGGFSRIFARLALGLASVISPPKGQLSPVGDDDGAAL